jgi:hypothetical protein
MTKKVDVRVVADVPNPTVYAFDLKTTKARRWVEANVADERLYLGGRLIVGHRWARSLADGMIQDGLVVR